MEEKWDAKDVRGTKEVIEMGDKMNRLKKSSRHGCVCVCVCVCLVMSYSFVTPRTVA